MRLRELLGEVGALVEGDVEVTGIAIDSRRVWAGDVFFALAGHTGDGARHVAEAVARGASAVVAAADVAAPGTPVVRIDQPRRVLGEAAARLAGDPSARFTLVGVTGRTGRRRPPTSSRRSGGRLASGPESSGQSPIASEPRPDPP